MAICLTSWKARTPSGPRSLPESALLITSTWCVSTEDRAVDVDCSSTQASGDCGGRCHVSAVHLGRQAVRGVIRYSNCLIDVGIRDYGEHRAEDSSCATGLELSARSRTVGWK